MFLHAVHALRWLAVLCLSFRKCLLRRAHFLTDSHTHLRIFTRAHSSACALTFTETRSHTHTIAHALKCAGAHPHHVPSPIKPLIHPRAYPLGDSSIRYFSLCARICTRIHLVKLLRAVFSMSTLNFRAQVLPVCTLERACARDESSCEKSACTTAQGISAALRHSYSIRYSKSASSHILDTTLVGKYNWTFDTIKAARFHSP